MADRRASAVGQCARRGCEESARQGVWVKLAAGDVIHALSEGYFGCAAGSAAGLVVRTVVL